MKFELQIMFSWINSNNICFEFNLNYVLNYDTRILEF